jgi:hypothetical protein
MVVWAPRTGLVVQEIGDLLERTAGQISPANASREQRIPGDQVLPRKI